ncbi:YkgJ family cysteine cluster protein [Geomesophilobacter sediminis]|uniref:YkgJ family cysteine cluster protein n=1 Tax=Geomesophilobacter sediminis TaxID=2798584 RepID=A0A8J7LYT1_9BACT|nr:YkgJ family cysteine cluster protein [Geomesophilobacter sediminis]MBJ6725521.1 YkgJ family cysteine cluster protein [Geomesophilobacter sediminis]
MTQAPLNLDRFASDLTDQLVAVLSQSREPALTRAVQRSAEAAEDFCRERPLACAAGCPHCCVLNVAVLLPEAMIIASWIQAQFSPTVFGALRERLNFHLSWSRWMDDEERIAKRMQCPMLDETGRCAIHPVRPLSCRGVASLDAASCHEAFRPIITDEAPLVVADLLRKALYNEAFTALARALRHHRLDDRSIDLGLGVVGFLDRPECRELLLCGAQLPRDFWA